MTIILNDTPIDCTLEREKTLGEALAALEREVEKSGETIVSVSLNGIAQSSDEFDTLYATPADGENLLAVNTESLISVYCRAAEALRSSLSDSGDSAAAETWAGYIASFDEKTADTLKSLIEQKKYGEARSIAEHILHTAENPAEALALTARKMKSLISPLADISVQFQMGKDSSALQTISEYGDVSAEFVREITEIRLFAENSLPDFIDGAEFRDFMSEYNAVLQDFIKAMTDGDTVLIGDLAEYEIIPRLEKLTNAFERTDDCQNAKK